MNEFLIDFSSASIYSLIETLTKETKHVVTEKREFDYRYDSMFF